MNPHGLGLLGLRQWVKAPRVFLSLELVSLQAQENVESLTLVALGTSEPTLGRSPIKERVRRETWGNRQVILEILLCLARRVGNSRTREVEVQAGEIPLLAGATGTTLLLAGEIPHLGGATLAGQAGTTLTSPDGVILSSLIWET